LQQQKQASDPALEERQPLSLDSPAGAVNLGPLAFDSVLLARGKKQAESPIRIEHLVYVGHANGHALAVFIGDRLQALRFVEDPRPALANLEPNHRALGNHVEHRPEFVGPVCHLQTPREPEATIGATDTRPGGVDGTAWFRGVLMDTRESSQLLEFIDSKHPTAQRAVTACPGLAFASVLHAPETPFTFP